MAKWEAQFNQLMNSQRDELEADYGASMQKAWENGLGDFSTDSAPGERLEFDNEGVPALGPYVFGLSSCPLVSNKATLPNLAYREKQQVHDGASHTFIAGRSKGAT